MMKGIVRLAVGLLAFGLATSTSMAAPGALWTTPLSSTGSFVYGSPTGGFLFDSWDGTSLDPAIGSSAGGQVAVGDHDPGVAPVFDSAGDVYRWGLTPVGLTEEMALEEDSPSGQVLWRTPVDAEQPHDVVLGSNHDLYASYFSNADGWHLLRLDANTGQVLWNDAGPAGVPEPTPQGVELVSAGRVQLVGGDESSGGAVSYAAGNTPELSSVAHNDQGDILALNLPQWTSGSCGYTTGPATIAELGPSGTQLWTREVPMSGCIHPTVAALPNGSWALSDQESGAILGLSGIDGSTLWTASTGPRNYGPVILGADANGDIVAAQNLATNCVPEPPNTTNCQGEEILKINGSTGRVSSVLHLVDTSSPNTLTFGLEDMQPGRDTNTSASIAPGRLFTVEEDLIGDPGNFTNSLRSFNGYSLAAGAPYPTPPNEAVGGGSSGGGGPIGSAGSPSGSGDSGTGAGGGAGSSGNGATHNLPIVMVPGIDSETNETTPAPGSRCPEEEPFELMCSMLRAKGYPVYVVSASKGPSTSAIVNSWGDIDTNAEKLAAYLKRERLDRPPLVVGHSMGGLIARGAISSDHTSAAGLFTMGTPYDGAFMADLGSVINDLVCPALSLSPVLRLLKVSCHTIEDALNALLPMGTEAAAELARHERLKEAVSLPVPKVPLWTIAGIGVPVPSGVIGLLASTGRGYYFPNDILVGESSAWGIDANLGPICKGDFTDIQVGCNHRLSTDAFHLASLLRVPLPGPAETSDPTIIADVLAVASQLSSSQLNATATVAAAYSRNTSGLRGRAVTATASDTHRLHAIHKKTRANPSVAVVALTAIGGGTATRPQTIPISSQGFVVSDHPFRVSCGGTSWEAESIVPGVWAMYGAAVRCAAVAKLPTGAGYLSAASAPTTHIRVTATAHGLSTIVRVFGARARSATLSRLGQRTVSLRRVHGHWQVAVRGQHKKLATITVVSGPRVFRGTLSL